MSKLNLDNISDMQYDVLKEVGSIGAGNATTALAKMVNEKIDLGVPNVRLCGLDELTSTIGEEEEVVVGTLMQVKGDVHGMMMFLMEVDIARNLLKAMGLPGNAEMFEPIEVSAIKEVGNIITSAYLGSLAELTNLRIDVSVPNLQVDMVASLLSVLAIEYGQIGDKILLIETKFNDEFAKSSLIKGYYILIPDMESYAKILDSLGM